MNNLYVIRRVNTGLTRYLKDYNTEEESWVRDLSRAKNFEDLGSANAIASAMGGEVCSLTAEPLRKQSKTMPNTKTYWVVEFGGKYYCYGGAGARWTSQPESASSFADKEEALTIAGFYQGTVHKVTFTIE